MSRRETDVARRTLITASAPACCAHNSERVRKHHGSRHQGQDGNRVCGVQGAGQGLRGGASAGGVAVTICARGAEALNATAKELSATGAKVTSVVCDVTTEEGRKALLAACPNPDILINNAGGPPPGDFKGFALDDWRKAVEGNMITPIALILPPSTA